MILHSVCNTCLQAYEVSLVFDLPNAASLLADLADSDGLGVCPRHCGGKINLKEDPSLAALSGLTEPLHLTVKELYQASLGMPLPDELPPSKEVITAMLLAHRVIGASVEEVAGRTYLHEIALDNGCVLHLCSGGRGAQLLKVTKNHESDL